MRYLITHTTTYTYPIQAAMSSNFALLRPRELTSQHCRKFELVIRPQSTQRFAFEDFFGNQREYFTIPGSHHALSVVSKSRVEVNPRSAVIAETTPPWESLAQACAWPSHSPELMDVCQFCYASPLIPLSPELRQMAERFFPPGQPVLEGAKQLTAAIHHDFTYDPTATTVTSTIEDVLAMKRGVCQDFAHLQIGCLRSMGLAARYVSGYLRTLPAPGKERLVGADASHAWISVYCGGQAGWVDLDPTNNLLVNQEHITVAWGRDYGDVPPVNGLVIGGGFPALDVKVDVQPVEKS
jgi:transglutaminase-like putative cysteine protease